MGKLITVVGSSGVGKTTLTGRLVKKTGFSAGLEQIAERPFQAQFAGDLQRYALANQVDFLLYRAEQELALRPLGEGIAIQDGGLDLDYHVFCRHFFEKGYLTGAELALCGRVYALARIFLPPPDLIIYLTAPLAVIQARYEKRGRPLEIARLDDLLRLDELVRVWIDGCDSDRVITVDAGRDDFCDPPRLDDLAREIAGRLA